MAMVKIKVDNIIVDQQKIKQEQDFYYETVGAQPVVDFRIEQYNMSHSKMFNIIKIKSCKINDQDVLGSFTPTPPHMIVGNYSPQQLGTKKMWSSIDCDGFWQVLTDGVNVLT